MFNTFFYTPLYNALVLLISIVPGKSAGLAVILLTVIIRLILFPLSRKAIKTQLQMKVIEPDVKRIQTEVKDRQEQARQLMALYKDKDINPFASFFLILLQLPVLLALYRVFQSGLPKIKTEILYHFVAAPSSQAVSMHLLFIDLTHKSITLAILAVATQFIQLNISLPKTKKQEKTEKASFQTDLAQSMNAQMKYIFPLILFPIAYISSVLGLYLVTSNIFMIFQEIFVRRRLAKKYGVKPV
jgi:YidC/Oxa1 family membrane protein insertase